MDFNQKFEPKGNRIIHGAGQQLPEDFRDYWKTVKECKPLLYMTYRGINQPIDSWFNKVRKEITAFPNVLPQIGLSMTVEIHGPQTHYEHDVAEGKYDEAIDSFCKGCEELEIPIYVRLGFEFNGLAWNGYLPEAHVRAWKHVVDRIKKNNVNNVATVWCYAVDGEKNYMDYYPGDEYVDWWGIDIFSPEHLRDEFTEKFMQDAVKHKKPVMIGESTPRYIGVLKGQESWDTWFKPFFRWIEQHHVVKAFCYINWDWSKLENWKDWGDSRISQNEIVKRNYLEEIRKPKYIHNLPINEFLKLVNY